MRSQPTKDPQILALIAAVRHNPCLYDYRQTEYYNNDYKEEVWKQIAKDCVMTDAGEAKTCWKNLHYSFTAFYRNELIRLVRANYDEAEIGTLPAELNHPTDERFGNHTWGYYGDMRFIAPFRRKGTDPELERLIELAKPIVLRTDEHKSKVQLKSKEEAKKTAASPAASTSENLSADEMTHFDIPAVEADELTAEEACLQNFYDAMFRSTCALPPHLQRRVKLELLRSINSAEMEADMATKYKEPTA